MEQDKEQPQVMIAPFDPVEALLNDLSDEVMMAVGPGEGAGFEFWQIVNNNFLEERVGSFDTSAAGFRESLKENKDAYDYGIRLMARLYLRPYFEEASKKTYDAFNLCLGIIGVHVNMEDFVNDPIIKIVMMISLNKPLFVTIMVGAQVKRPRRGQLEVLTKGAR